MKEMWHNYNHRFQQFLGAQFTCSCSGFFHFWDLLDLILVCVKILTHPFLNRDDEDDDMLVFLPAWSDLYLPFCQILWQPWWWWARRVSRCSMHRSTLFSSVAQCAHHTATPFNKGSSWSCLGTQSCLKGPQSDFIDQTLTYLPKYTCNQQQIQAGRRFKICGWKLPLALCIVLLYLETCKHFRSSSSKSPPSLDPPLHPSSQTVHNRLLLLHCDAPQRLR